jgi:hypothetical protein
MNRALRSGLLNQYPPLLSFNSIEEWLCHFSLDRPSTSHTTPYTANSGVPYPLTNNPFIRVHRWGNKEAQDQRRDEKSQERKAKEEGKKTYDRQKANLKTQCPISSPLLSATKSTLLAVLLDRGRYCFK